MIDPSKLDSDHKDDESMSLGDSLLVGFLLSIAIACATFTVASVIYYFKG